MSGRKLEALTIPGGARAPEVLEELARALDGAGPALLPVADADTPAPQGGPLGVGEPLDDHEDDTDDPTALVIATSGSTGTPKGVLLSASALRASATATHHRLGGPGHWVLAMPAQHIAGIQVLIRSLIAGTRPVAVEASDGFRPDAFVDAAQRALRTSGPHYTALVPTQLGRILRHQRALAALRSFDAVLLGGAATPPAMLREAREAGVAVVTTYGMSETAGGCVYDGVPLDGAQVALDEAGVISLTGPMLARGYRRVAGGFADGWFRTGDLGRWVDGRLEVLGRADDVIVTGGVNIAPQAVERILAEQGGVREACVVGVDDPEWGQAVVAAVVPATDPAPDAEDLRAAVRRCAGAAATPKRVVFLPELPLRGPGKPDRRALRTAVTDAGPGSTGLSTITYER